MLITFLHHNRRVRYSTTLPDKTLFVLLKTRSYIGASKINCAAWNSITCHIMSMSNLTTVLLGINILCLFVPALNVTKMDRQIEEIIRRVLMIKEPSFTKYLARNHLDG